MMDAWLHGYVNAARNIERWKLYGAANYTTARQVIRANVQHMPTEEWRLGMVDAFLDAFGC